jgi:hypothetical protein
VARDDLEEARVGNLDHRFNHWTAVRDALVVSHADLFQQKTPATFREILDAMWLFNDKFEQALSKFDQTHNRRENQLPR